MMVCAPTASAEVWNVAMPLDSVPVPSVLAPSLNVTVPVGAPEAGAVTETVAVKVTDCPDTLGLADGASAVVVAPWFTV